MTNGDQSVFTFDLNESLWFKKGQEVDEIMGISLEPEISIQESEDFVSVRGVIELKGEYFQVKNSEEEEEQVLSLSDHPSQRFVDRVDSNEDGVNEFIHNFPVEASIPKYRIESLDDVLVGIESFDYELPETSQLKLNATVAIHGVKQDQPREEAVAESGASDQSDHVTEEVPEPPQPPVDETFEFDVKEQTDEDSELQFQQGQVEESPERDTQAEVEEEIEDVEAEPEPELEPAPEVESSEKKPSEKDRWKNKKSQSFAEFFSHFDKDENKEKAEEVVEEAGESSSVSDIISFSSYGKEESSDELESSRDEVRTNDPTYLLNIFGDGDEERVASMKMCIVQESDTLGSIAEKYNVTPMQLSNTNRLESDDLSEGQILYIPSKVTKFQ